MESSFPGFQSQPGFFHILRIGDPYMDVSKNSGVKPPKWMVKIMENPIKMDDLGVP